MKKKSLLGCLFIVLILGNWTPALAESESWPITVAESSNFTATSRYKEVISFIHELQQQSALIKVETMCVSPEGRDIPLVIIGNPVPTSPSDLIYDKRAVVYIQANIHAGEVEGKEAVLMLMRDILRQKQSPYLDDLVILVAPIFNADGNERISPANRRNQDGPEKGVGIRYNGQNLDLNRDGLKMESPEVQGMVKNVLQRWSPVILVDCHTTNGSYHEEPVTYSWPLNPNGDSAIIEYMRDLMMPALTIHLKEKYQTLAIPYGNFMGREMQGWRTFSHLPRYITNCVGLRNRLSILIENYSHAEYKTRIMGNYHYLLSILDYCHTHKDEIVSLIRDADDRTVKRGLNPAENDLFAVEFEAKALKDPVTILGWEMEAVPGESRFPRMKRPERKKTYTLPYYADFVPKRSVKFPAGYLITVSAPEVIEKLTQHGIAVEKLTKAITLDVEGFQIKELKSSERLNQGHYLNTVTGEYVKETREFPEGTVYVTTAQPLANLAAYLLEPESDDGFLVWNFFDRFLATQWRRAPQTYPVYKLLKPAKLVTKIVSRKS